MPSRTPRARAAGAVLVLVVLLLAAARPAAAEGSGYDGGGGGLRTRSVASGKVIEVRGDGFLADSRVTVRVDHRRPVTVTADDGGAFVARVPITAHASTPSSGASGSAVVASASADPQWVTASGTDPSFTRRTVTSRLAHQTPGTDPATIALALAGVLLAASVLLGPVRHGWSARGARRHDERPASPRVLGAAA